MLNENYYSYSQVGFAQVMHMARKSTDLRLGGARQPTRSEATARDVVEAIARHGKAANGIGRVIVEPLGRDESVEMQQSYNMVASYLVIQTEDFMKGSESELLERLAKKLSVLSLSDVTRDVVWDNGQTMAIYVKGKLST